MEQNEFIDKNIRNLIRLNTEISSTSTKTIKANIENSDNLEFDLDVLDAQFERVSLEFKKNIDELRQNPENRKIQEKLLSTNEILEEIRLCSSTLNSKEGRERMKNHKEKQNVRMKNLLRRKYEIDEILKLTEINSTVDVCFLMDCTGSMREYIDVAKSQVRTLTQTISHLYSTKTRLAFVGYRDIEDKTEKLDFTDDEKYFEQFLNQVQAKGGDDTCEDVFGGLQIIADLSWKNFNRVLIHICDAPCHGQDFHEFQTTADDNYLRGDPKKRNLIDLMFNIKRLEIIYCKIELNQTTKKMFEKFSFIYGSIEEIHVEKADDLIKSVIQKTSDIIQTNIQTSLTSFHSSRGPTKVYSILKKEPLWNSIKIEPIDVFQIVSLKSIDEIFQPLKIVQKTGEMKISSHPFAKGSLRYAYYGQYRQEDLNFIDVVYKELASVNPQQQGFLVYQEHLEIQSIAQFLSEKFNEIQENSFPIIYADANLVRTKSNPEKFYQVERRMKDVWHKWNNNSGAVSLYEYSSILQAFSHWTYHFTDGRLMVVDLQGVQVENTYLLTDPALHTEDFLRFNTTRTNLGTKGMQQFFRTHICSRFCEKLMRPEGINSTKLDLFADFRKELNLLKNETIEKSSNNQIIDDFENINEEQFDSIEIIEAE